MRRGVVALAFLVLAAQSLTARGQEGHFRVGVFDVDASPPVGSPLAYEPPTRSVGSPLRCRGVVLTGPVDPIVLCAVDWIGIGNGGQVAFREQLAEAAGTSFDRVAVHALHQHDAPRCDFTVLEMLAQHGIADGFFDGPFARDVLERAAAGVRHAVETAEPVTHLGLGRGVVERVASNRRILGPDGRVRVTRWTASPDPEVRALPTGTIDPELKLLSFWNEDRPLAVLTYYATHPQSYYRTGIANSDFPGMARDQRDEATGVVHVHFNGAGGNIGAGKWNDGSPENRQILADRVAAGMLRAWESTEKMPVTAADVGWETVPAVLPAAPHLDEDALSAILEDDRAEPVARFAAANDLAWLRRCQAREAIVIGELRVGRARVLHLPGELFIEYQLAAQRMRPDLFVAMAAYGDYAPGYIGTAVAYSQGGYEASPRASNVAPGVESVLLQAIEKLLE